MHLETLKTFCDLVETGSFGKAAERNLVTQSAVSQQLKALERRYGCRLIERGPGLGVTPTESGQLLYREWSDLLQRFLALDDRLRRPSHVVAGAIRLATVYSIGLHELPPYVTRFMKAYPQVAVHVEYSRTDRICDACIANAIDFGIVAFPVRRARITVVPWHEEPLVLVCHPAHPLARRRRVALRDLAGEPFIAFDRDIPTRKTIDAILRAQRVRVRTVMEFDNIETIKRSIEVGSGLSILPETTIVNEVRSGLLASAALTGGRFTRTVGIVHRRGKELSAAAAAFVRMLRDDER